MKSKFLSIALFLPLCINAQDNLIKNLDGNESDSSKNKFEFKHLIDLGCTDVKNQGKSGTCWSYSTNSFLESEMIRQGKKPVDIAEIYTARCVYKDKAENYVRMHGKLEYGDGGACHDVINMYEKYGAMPQSVYSGLNYGTDKNQFGEMQAILEGMLQAVVRNPNKKLTPNWRKAFNAVLDAYLGEVPETFNYNGKLYTAKSFAREVVGLNPDDYIEFSSFSYLPYYEKSILMVPDNWSFDKVYNVRMNDMTTVIDNALKKGYTVAWATDVSEKYFSWKNGVAYVPEMEWEDMDDSTREDIFNGPQKDRKITEEARQTAFDNYTTTDDHGMHIVGLAEDQNGKEYYIVKNSWGEKNDYEGYIYVTKPYVQYKTTAFLVHKGAVPSSIMNKLH